MKEGIRSVTLQKHYMYPPSALLVGSNIEAQAVRPVLAGHLLSISCRWNFSERRTPS